MPKWFFDNRLPLIKQGLVYSTDMRLTKPFHFDMTIYRYG